MNTSFKESISKKSLDELLGALREFEKYIPQAIEVILAELKSRDYNIPEAELESMNKAIEIYKESDKQDELLDLRALTRGIVPDLNAPLLYSKLAIVLFSVFATPLFGAVLLSINIEKKKKKEKVKVISVGILFFLSIFLSAINPFRLLFLILYLILNFIGGHILVNEFWYKYIGNKIVYRAKPIWIPLIISIIITVPFLIAMIYE
jgi:hypothetical protein